MKVIVTSPVWSLNGVNTFSGNLVRGLRTTGIDATVLLTGVTYRERKPLPLPADIPAEQLHIPGFATWKSRQHALLEYLESQAPCIYLPNHDFLHSAVTSALSPKVGVVGVVHSDDAQHYGHASRMGKTWNAAIAVSEAIAERLRIAGTVEASRLSVIPYGVPASDPYPVRQPIPRLRLIYAGRLDSPQKRVGDLVAIASSLMRRGVDFTLTIVGDGSERTNLERAIENNGLEQRVILPGSVGNDRIVEMYPQFDGFLLPSAYEGMPVGVLEAMGQGCVPFATQIDSGVPQLVRHGENGFVAPVGNVERFAELIEGFSKSDETRRRMSREAWRTIIEGGYRIDDMTARYHEVFVRVWKEMNDGTFRRSGVISTVPMPLRERIASPLWSLRPAIRAQQRLSR